MCPLRWKPPAPALRGAGTAVTHSPGDLGAAAPSTGRGGVGLPALPAPRRGSRDAHGTLGGFGNAEAGCPGSSRKCPKYVAI